MIINNTNHTKFYINGHWVDPQSSEKINVINPSTEKTFTTISSGNELDVNIAVNAAEQAFEVFQFTSIERRIEMLQAILKGMKSRSEELSEVITLELGCPRTFSNEQQTASGIDHLEVMINTLTSFEFEKKVGNAIVRKEPIGVCALITPWNWPINQISCKVFAAIAAGCTMILKPSEITPISALILTDIVHQAKLPDGVFNLVNGTGEVVGATLASHPKTSMVSITGSTRAGVVVAKLAADSVKRVHQELGGNSPNIILDDADLEVAVKNGTLSVFSNSGQTCDSPARMLMPNHLIDDSIKIIKQTTKGVIVGDPTNKETDVGPLVSKEHFQKVQSLIQLAIDEGAEVICGGVGKPEQFSTGYFCQPTVLYVSSQSQIANEEIFGPVMLLIGYKTQEEAICIANNTQYGLAGYIQTSNIAKAKLIAAQLQCGTVQINYPEYNAQVPFGGRKQSGNGREYAEYGLNDFLEYKSIIGV